MTVFTVDVSNHDNDRRGSPLNWTQIRAAGITVACSKATEGDPAGYWYADPHFAGNATGARAAGLLSGGYHVLSAGNTASINRQVAAFRGALAAAGAAWAMLDVEPFVELESRGLAPTMADVARFGARWLAVDPRPLVVYLPRWYWSRIGSPSLTGLPGPLVSSDYGPNATGGYASLYVQRNGDTGSGWTPYGGVTPALWQFGSQAVIPGASDASDVNAYRGTLTQLTALLTGQEADVSLTPAQDGALAAAWQVSDALRHGGPTPGRVPDPGAAEPVWLVDQVKTVATQTAANGAGLSELKTSLTALAGKVDQLAAAPPGTVTLTDEQLERVLRKVLGSLDGATPA